MISRIYLVKLAKLFFEDNLGQLSRKLLELLERFENDSTMTVDALRAKLLSMGIDESLINQSFPEITPVFG